MGFGLCCVGVASGVTFLVVALVGLALNRVDYYEYGFLKQRIGGQIDRSEVFSQGLYLTSPNSFFVTFESTAVDLELSNLAVWSRANQDDAGTPLDIDVTLQYRLNPDDLEELYAKVGFNHKPFVRNVVVNAIKNNATLFSADEYLTKRRIIRDAFLEAVVAEAADAAGVEVINLQLHHVTFPSTFYSRKLEAALQVQRNLIEVYKRNSTLVRGNTTIIVEQIENEAAEIRQRATAEADLIRQRAENRAIAIRGQSEREGLKSLFTRLNIVDQKDILSLNYLLNLQTRHTGKKLVNLPGVLQTMPIT